ncbi:MAG: MMPL family transporter [Acidimicrobiales bacterium]|nr:MMPL family transporter [Acidimicrobiales bacterium]
MNLLSIAAAYGVVVAVFQWGWGAALLGIEAGPINPFIPLMLFAIVFGLSMDYEVFMLSRIREEYDRTGDASTSVADGLASTARVITAAAAIMVVVFGSFVFEDIREIKLFGLGLGLAVFLDATLARMVLVPATMALLGDRNWWMPPWLDRLVPLLLDRLGEPRLLPPSTPNWSQHEGDDRSTPGASTNTASMPLADLPLKPHGDGPGQRPRPPRRQDQSLRMRWSLPASSSISIGSAATCMTRSNTSLFSAVVGSTPLTSRKTAQASQPRRLLPSTRA